MLHVVISNILLVILLDIFKKNTQTYVKERKLNSEP
jgi:hypothetical protein